MSAPISAECIARNATDIITSARVTKNPKACEECRRKKQKCDGQTPCGLCTKRRTQCSYRAYIRQRGVRASSHTQDARVTPCDNDGASDGLPQSMPPRLHIFNNIRATQDTGRRRTELFYGASSPFSVLQHLDTHLPTQGSPPVYPNPNAEEVQDGGESIKSYNYQSIVFDHLPNPIQHHEGPAPTSYASAKVALRNFLVTAYPRLPFLDPNSLCTAFENKYHDSDGTALTIADNTLVVIALGLGALPLIDLPCRQQFLTQARAEAVSMMYNISLKTVQATLMMAQFELEAGSPNICYLHLGSAIRKAFAAGVHRIDTLEAKQTMWALYCSESLLCFKFGRQFGLTDENIAVPRQDDTSHLSYFVRLCTIVRSAYRIYHRSDTVAADLACAKFVNQQLCEFSATMKTNIGLEIGGQLYALAGENLVWYITISYIYYITKLLLYRPFLLLCLELKRRGINDPNRVRSNGVVKRELAEAATICIQSAHALVELCESLFSLQIGIEGIYNHTFYLESACFVLGLAAVYDSNGDAVSCLLERINTGLQLLRRLGPREPVQSIAAAVEQMVARIRTLPSSSEANTTRVIGHSQPSSTAAHMLYHAGQSESSLDTDSTFIPTSETFTPVGWENEVLDDLWSMMDWNVGFLSSDPMSLIPMSGS